ncbi:RagB/SusD family nutrient uptake outer membrane protein [Mucilaginibacter sabulilitoris]|uniref:RagB/SusD family nutrient uptake outer membrane protein n=1 Tax=Mucilaginibacter sabulilitoris TaxID=1173583 RepID=A0ABZ0TL52_9SPHI|nr:RagB/SusD family nutrient uptake outer membrane protein [Mucilaginibacter sabulilitoris]WPU93142.1 RagB/SusD family nutrient uptake outer membrane protein [Mucilaginibacter sabulilitoris]
MKKLNKYNIYYSWLLLAVVVLPMAACKKYLDNVPKDSIAGDVQWSNETTADLFLNDIYHQINNQGDTPDPLDSYTDDNDGGPYWKSWRWRQGIIGPGVEDGTPQENDGNASNYEEWNAVYAKIRKCNTFIQEVNAHSANLSQAYRNKRIDEVRFLRAFFYSYLWMHVGGLPIITVPQDRSTDTHDELFKPRSTFGDTFNFIDTQLDSVVNNNYLAKKYNAGEADAGRATIGAALALKGWIELYAASPAFNTASAVMGSDPNKFFSFGNTDVTRYTKAAATNKKFMDELGGTYGLYPDMTTFWKESNEYNTEVIFDRQAVANTTGSAFCLFGGPVYIQGQYFTWGNYDPTQELVDQFRMDNGLPITDPKSGYDPQHPYLHREKRFYDWIVYDGAPYKQNWMTGTDTIFTRINKVHPSLNEIDFGSSDVSNTAYYFKKRLNPDIRPSGGASDGVNYVYFRYAEVLLNYAEAQNEAGGPSADVYAALDKIRVRSQLPTLEAAYGGQTLSQEQMRAVIRNERRVELCWENKRYYDIIRWRIAESVLNVDRHGMKITNTSPADNKGVWKYEPVLLNHPHVFTPKMYLNPIPQPVIDRNPNIKQNPNY